MTDTLLTLALILFAFIVAIAIMRFKRPRTVKKHITHGGQVQLWDITNVIQPRQGTVYDPSQDPERTLKGENESYFNQTR